MIKFDTEEFLMSIKEIKEQLKNNIDNLSPAEAKLAQKDLNVYFGYLHARKEMPAKARLSFQQFNQLMLSLKQSDDGKTIPAQKVFSAIKKKYGIQA
ncbi:MAG TPA: hypothetical protein VKT28_19110 [Puia sp.]|nr:hypothetical protein [Puia sp.]